MAVVALAMLLWAAMSLHAKVTHQPPPWKRHDRREPTPMAKAYWGSGAEFPDISPEQRRHNIRLMAGIMAGYLLAAAAGASVTWAITHQAGPTIVAAVAAFVGFFLVLLPIAAVVEARRAGRR